MLRGSHGFWFPGPKVDPEAVAPKDFFPIVIFFKDSRALIVKYPPANVGEMGCRFDSWVGKTPLEESTAIHSSILAWRIPWTEEPGGLYSPRGRKESNTTEATWHAHACDFFGLLLRLQDSVKWVWAVR